MLRDITVGQYYPTNSIIHKLDPRTKFICTFIFIFLIFFINSFLGFLIAYLFIYTIIVISKVPLKFIIKGLKPLLFIAIFAIVLNIFFTPGNVIFQYRFIRITQEGIKYSIFLILRLSLLVIGSSLLTLTTTPIKLTDAMESILSPLSKIGFPSHEIAMMMSIALRFIPTLIEETQKIMKAQQARGADFENGNLLKRLKNMIPILIPLFISSFHRADELANAMEARCYRGGNGRTKLNPLKYARKDAVAFCVVLIFSSIVIGIRFL